MKKLTKILSAALKANAVNKHLCIDLHSCNKDTIKALIKRLPVGMIIRYSTEGVHWTEYAYKDCDEISRVELTAFFD